MRAIEGLIAAQPGDLRLLFGRACALEDLGRPDDARHAYDAILAADPQHFGALTNLGSLWLERSEPTRAWAYFQRALVVDPADAIANLNMARVYLERGAPEVARLHYEAVLARPSHNRLAHFHANLGLALLAERNGDATAAASHHAAAFRDPPIWVFPHRGEGRPLRVLVLSSPRGGDVVSNLFFDERTTERVVLMPEAFAATGLLPPHDLIFNGIGEPDLTARSLRVAVELAAISGKPLINDPRAVLRSDRATMMQRLGTIAGLRAPLTRRYQRDEVDAGRLGADGFTFPLLVRAAGFHGGAHFERVDDADALAAVLGRLPGTAFYAIAFADARGDDGWVRKYRAVFVDGRLYPIHLAIARQWKVHYFSAAMSDHPNHRAEEARFLDDPRAVLGAPAWRALEAIVRDAGLDYGGIDFAVDAAGTPIIFEVNATMAVYPPGDDPRWDYRRAAIDRALAAVRALVAARASSSSSSAAKMRGT